MATLDVFKTDAFSLTALIDRVNKMPFVPGAAGRLGIFTESGIPTTTMMIEEYNGTLNLIPTSPRGAPATQNRHAKRTARYLAIPHLALEDRILAEEVQNVREFGTENQMQSVDSVLNLRLAEMNKKHDATIEYSRIGAIKGLVLDSDGTTTIFDLFAEFGVSQTVINYPFTTTTTSVVGIGTQVRDAIQVELGFDGTDDMEVVAFCGPAFFDALVQHPNVAEAYKYYQSIVASMNPLQMDIRYKGFTHGGVTYYRYRGTVGGVAFIAANEGYAFPTNVPGLFVTRYAPADFAETVNTMGLPRYAKMAPDLRFNQFVDVHTQSNPLSLNLRPKTSIKLTKS